MTASQVLKAQTNKNGLLGPCQLTSEKLNILINTPVISIARMFRVTTSFNLLIVIIISLVIHRNIIAGYCRTLTMRIER